MYNVYFVKIDCTLKSEGGGGKGAFYWQKKQKNKTFSAIFPEIKNSLLQYKFKKSYSHFQCILLWNHYCNGWNWLKLINRDY